KVVAFVGDGINDAPALKQADVSFSVSNASDIASDAADVVMLDNDLRLVLIAIDLSKKTTINIMQNLIWAFMYNLIMIPLSILNITSPLLAGFLHVISSISVVLNALRLNLYKYKKTKTQGKNEHKHKKT
ncbi:MAG: cation-translocating P-type ATPase, partial [Acholeplasmataceae bacterium]|nr:cation-translocating P-type ATPase [Acholeplasmataceae bacterium]